MQYLISTNMQPYTVKVQFVQEANSWKDVLQNYPNAELVKELAA